MRKIVDLETCCKMSMQTSAPVQPSPSPPKFVARAVHLPIPLPLAFPPSQPRRANRGEAVARRGHRRAGEPRVQVAVVPPSLPACSLQEPKTRACLSKKREPREKKKGGKKKRIPVESDCDRRRGKNVFEKEKSPPLSRSRHRFRSLRLSGTRIQDQPASSCAAVDEPLDRRRWGLILAPAPDRKEEPRITGDTLPAHSCP